MASGTPVGTGFYSVLFAAKSARSADDLTNPFDKFHTVRKRVVA